MPQFGKEKRFRQKSNGSELLGPKAINSEFFTKRRTFFRGRQWVNVWYVEYSNFLRMHTVYHTLLLSRETVPKVTATTQATNCWPLDIVLVSHIYIYSHKRCRDKLCLPKCAVHFHSFKNQRQLHLNFPRLFLIFFRVVSLHFEC